MCRSSLWVAVQDGAVCRSPFFLSIFWFVLPGDGKIDISKLHTNFTKYKTPFFNSMVSLPSLIILKSRIGENSWCVNLIHSQGLGIIQLTTCLKDKRTYYLHQPVKFTYSSLYASHANIFCIKSPPFFALNPVCCNYWFQVQNLSILSAMYLMPWV